MIFVVLTGQLSNHLLLDLITFRVASSGTEEEILRAIINQKKLLLYFSNTPIPPHNINTVEYEKVKEFRLKYKDSGLYKIDNSEVDFKKKFQNDLSAFMADLIDGNSLKNARAF